MLTYNKGVKTLLDAVTAAVDGTALKLSHAFLNHTWEIVVTGAPSAVNVKLQGSLNGTTWYDLADSTTLTSEMKHLANKTVLYIRAKLVTLTGGSSPTVTVRWMPSIK